MRPSSKNLVMNGVIESYVSQKTLDESQKTSFAETWKAFNGDEITLGDLFIDETAFAILSGLKCSFGAFNCHFKDGHRGNGLVWVKDGCLWAVEMLDEVSLPLHKVHADGKEEIFESDEKASGILSALICVENGGAGGGTSANAVTIDTAQTITGAKTFSKPIAVDEIDNLKGNAMARYKESESKIVLGSSNFPTVLMGSGDRPYYSKDGADFDGEEMALLNDLYIKVTYAELKSLRDNSKLIKGATYRITDYQCTTIQFDTQSAGHIFDILVVADDVNTLNENSHAIIHDGDTYFVNSKLSAWELKYTLDNDTTRFAWADEINGKGVIYYMKDEFNNECPYDFKNIQFKRYITTQVDDILQDILDYDWIVSNYIAINGNNVSHIENYDENDFKWFYTFTTNDYIDASLNENNKNLSNEGYFMQSCWNNCIKPLMQSNSIDEADIRTIQTLNNIVLISDNENDTKDTPCKLYSNIFDFGCYDITINGHFYNNKLGLNNYISLFFKCYSNTFGNGCNSNTFGNDCDSNTFGNDCNSNTFGNGCNSNTFGNGCDSNTFGNDCDSNTFGNDCDSNTFGNDCNSNTLLDNATNNESKAYAKWNIFDNGVKYVVLTASDSGSGESYLQNIHIHSGIVGISSSKKTITETRNLAYSTDYYATGYQVKTI